MITETQAVDRFSALSDSSRLSILRILVRAGPKGMGAGDIARAVGASPSRASFHLTALARADLVASRREARRIIYTVRFDALGELLRFLVEDCCAGDASLRGCCG
ncbi:metalloregulator ArsR/SmtB family transcription factor [Jannaschia sp. S6380]|uniref:ArsR/SmtB family transcription factor n=1 Tax=Jannaschia sp. S6380 TaxID=2926408 RepID=UPI001FF3094B|nr:metalloregulator ArsR/SmtB family transcription factor [Jannaschia sp. S6380]MCK0169108.1 metalloregulator ArsR/SmtB family transcription factor [Jannaschia sp. S6380]